MKTPPPATGGEASTVYPRWESNPRPLDEEPPPCHWRRSLHCVPPVGIEPTTVGLKVHCPTTGLRGRGKRSDRPRARRARMRFNEGPERRPREEARLATQQLQ